MYWCHLPHLHRKWNSRSDVMYVNLQHLVGGTNKYYVFSNWVSLLPSLCPRCSHSHHDRQVFCCNVVSTRLLLQLGPCFLTVWSGLRSLIISIVWLIQHEKLTCGSPPQQPSGGLTWHLQSRLSDEHLFPRQNLPSPQFSPLSSRALGKWCPWKEL